MRQVHRAALTVGLVGLLAGCGLTGPDDRADTVTPPPDASGSPTSSGGAVAPPDEVVSVERELHEARVRFDLRPVEADGDLAVLRYEYTAEPAGDDSLGSGTVPLSLGGLGRSVTDGRGVRLVDTDAQVVHPVAQAADGTPAAELDQERGDDFDAALEQTGGAGTGAAKELRAFTQGYDAGSATSAEDDDVTVTLASDVLFDSDEDSLSRSARGVVERAAASIVEQADAGDVHVVGHTDDVDTDAYNQALSERRARSVAERLRADLGGGFTVTEEGRGESEPVAEGRSAEARAANRRVEIHFQGHLVVDTSAESEAPGTDAPTARDAAVTIETGKGEYRVEVESVQRRPGALVGTLVAERTDGTGIDPAWFLPAHLKMFGDRRFGALAEVAGPHNLSLLGARERVLPYDYVAEERTGGFVLRRLLGDEEVQTLDQGQSATITVYWPDTGQDTVTVDAPERFRITDVPVTDPAP